MSRSRSKAALVPVVPNGLNSVSAAAALSAAAAAATNTAAANAHTHMSLIPTPHAVSASMSAVGVPPFAAAPFLLPTPSSPMLVHVLRLAAGAELHASISEFLRVHRAEAATILSAAGTLTHANIRFAGVADELVKPQPASHYEIVSLGGTLSLSAGNHIHISIADSKGHTLGGRMMPTGNIVSTTVELAIGVLPNLLFKRETDPTFGLKELVVYPANKMGVPLSFLGPDLSMPFVTAPMTMGSMPMALKRKAEDEKPIAATASIAGSATKKAKTVKMKKETGLGEEKEEKNSKTVSKLNPSVLTLANMPLMPTGGPLPSPVATPTAGASTSPPSGIAATPAKPQAQLWTPAQFSVFLKSLKLDHLVPIFQWHKVDAKQFLELKLTDIRDRLGIRDPADVANVLNCVAEGTLVTMADGSAVPIESVEMGRKVLAVTKDGSLVPRHVTAVLDQGVKACLELTFLDGRQLVCTEDHLVRRDDGEWTQAGKLRPDVDSVSIGASCDGTVTQPDQPLSTSSMLLSQARPVGVYRVYDLTVPSEESEDEDPSVYAARQQSEASFVANGIVVHNCINILRGSTTSTTTTAPAAPATSTTAAAAPVTTTTTTTAATTTATTTTTPAAAATTATPTATASPPDATKPAAAAKKEK